MPDEILGFHDQYRYLSNFWYANILITPISWGLTQKGRQQPFIAKTNEHAYQALKCQFNTDTERILQTYSPGQAKKEGKRITVHRDWESIKLETMYQINSAKYRQHKQLRDLLIATGTAYLEEANYWGDTYWGVCHGVGNNHLGKILMRIRGELS